MCLHCVDNLYQWYKRDSGSNCQLFNTNQGTGTQLYQYSLDFFEMPASLKNVLDSAIKLLILLNLNH